MMTRHPSWVRPGLAAACLLLTTGLARGATAPIQTLPTDASRQLAGRSAPRSERYTAQRKPRLAVSDFTDTNETAQSAKYRDAVRSMLVTFLKRKSQFIIVERLDYSKIKGEWELATQGRVNQDSEAQGRLEKIDALILGTVTLLDAPPVAQEGSAAARSSSRHIEIDVKALGRSDGRIIAAAQRSGEIGCLRSIVARIGIALEQEFLRPYYGRLQFQLSEPENARLFLTPILLEHPLDEERPPVERGESIIVGGERDLVQPWVTDPASYTVENLLSGWYTVWVDRPGYEGVGIRGSNEDWFVRELGGKTAVYHRETCADEPCILPLDRLAADQSRFVVHVDPRGRTTLDGDDSGFSLRKKVGSLAPVVRRQFLDSGGTRTAQRVLLVGSENLDINRVEHLADYDDSQTCKLFDESDLTRTRHGSTVVPTGQRFDIDSFKGGKLVFENYQGEEIPAGQYEMYLWEPHYEVLASRVAVNDRDRQRQAVANLRREARPLTITTNGPRPPYKLFLTGAETGHRVELDLTFGRLDKYQLPVDHYAVSTTIPGLRGWNRSIDLLPVDVIEPVYDQATEKVLWPGRIEEEGKNLTIEVDADKAGAKAEKDGTARVGALKVEAPKDVAPKDGAPKDSVTKHDDEHSDQSKAPTPAPPPQLRIKTRLALGGRFSVLGALTEIETGEVFLDDETLPALAAALDAEQADRRWFDCRKAGGRCAEREDLRPTAQLNEGASRAIAARRHLAETLAGLDLLVLDDLDMVKLKKNQATAAVIEDYVAAGGALYAFVSRTGNYQEVVGATLLVEDAGRWTSRFRLARGEVAGIDLDVGPRKLRVGSRRRLMRPKDGFFPEWRVVSFRKERHDPTILERGGDPQGGYIALWFDRPSRFCSRFGRRRVPAVEELRARMDQYVLDQVRSLMRRRYDSPPQPVAAAQP